MVAVFTSAHEECKCTKSSKEAVTHSQDQSDRLHAIFLENWLNLQVKPMKIGIWWFSQSLLFIVFLSINTLVANPTGLELWDRKHYKPISSTCFPFQLTSFYFWDPVYRPPCFLQITFPLLVLCCDWGYIICFQQKKKSQAPKRIAHVLQTNSLHILPKLHIYGQACDGAHVVKP